MIYPIKVDTKVYTWIRHTVEVEANSINEALCKVINNIKKNQDLFNNEDLTIVSSEELMDTEEQMSVDNNAGCSTIEVLYNNKVFWDNA